MTFFKKNDALITLGGWNGKIRLKEVIEHSLKRNEWRALPCFPFRVAFSSICILKNEWLYNLGGWGNKWSVGKLALTGTGKVNHNKWSEVKLINKNMVFSRAWKYGAYIIGRDSIVFFGKHREKGTFILKEHPVEEDTLCITQKASTIDYYE